MNTRSQFVFFNQLVHDAGWAIDWQQIDPYVFVRARTVAIAGNEAGIEALLRPPCGPSRRSSTRTSWLYL